MMMTNQMELGFDPKTKCPGPLQARRKFQRAQWWFKQIRRAVEMAPEWRPVPTARSEQVYMVMEPARR